MHFFIFSLSNEKLNPVVFEENCGGAAAGVNVNSICGYVYDDFCRFILFEYINNDISI